MTTPAPSPEALDVVHALGCECSECATLWRRWWLGYVLAFLGRS